MTELVRAIGLDELKAYFKTLPEDTFEIAKSELGAASLRVQKEVVGRFRAGSEGSGGTRLYSRTGKLRRSILTTNKGTKLENVTSSVFSKKIYAPIQEEGGTITAKNAYTRVPGGPYLNIPLRANKTRAGVTRMQAREVFAAGGSLFQSRRGNWLVALNGQLMFVLVKSVTIPARLGMQEEAEDEVPTLLSSLRTAVTKRLAE